MGFERTPTGAQIPLRKIATLVQDQRSCLGRLEHESITQTIWHLAELRTSIRNAGIPHAAAGPVIRDILAVIDTHLTRFQSVGAAHERRITSLDVATVRPCPADDREDRHG